MLASIVWQKDKASDRPLSDRPCKTLGSLAVRPQCRVVRVASMFVSA
jgi:hypothetical protein